MPSCKILVAVSIIGIGAFLSVLLLIKRIWVSMFTSLIIPIHFPIPEILVRGRPITYLPDWSGSQVALQSRKVKLRNKHRLHFLITWASGCRYKYWVSMRIKKEYWYSYSIPKKSSLLHPKLTLIGLHHWHFAVTFFFCMFLLI